MDSAALPHIDLAIIVVYMLVTVGVGALFMKKNTSMEAFTVGSRSIPGWAVGLSILGTYFSSISFLAIPGDAYGGNWAGFVFSLTIPIACVISHFFFIPLFRGKLHTTAYEHLEHRFGSWARAYCAASLVLLQVGRIGAVLYMLALALNQLLNWDMGTIVVVLTIITLIYTSLGGIEGVIWTDVIQTIIFIVGAAACVIILLLDMPEGPGQFIEIAQRDAKLSFGGWDFDLAKRAFWMVLIYGIAENIKNFGVDQNYVQRFLAAKSDREAAKSMWLGGLGYIPVSAMFFLIGTALYTYYNSLPAFPEGFPVDEAGKVTGDKVFPYFIVRRLPIGVTGIVIAALMAAAMSTLSSNLNSAATVWAVDVHKRFINKHADDKSLLRMTMLATVAIGVLGAGFSFFFMAMAARDVSALDLWWSIAGIAGGGMIGLFLVGIMFKRCGALVAGIGVILGTLAIFWGTFTVGDESAWAFPFHKNMIGLTGTVVILIVGAVGALVFPSAPRVEPDPQDHP